MLKFFDWPTLTFHMSKKVTCRVFPIFLGVNARGQDRGGLCPPGSRGGGDSTAGPQ